jgi:hypothetical protein
MARKALEQGIDLVSLQVGRLWACVRLVGLASTRSASRPLSGAGVLAEKN